MSGNGNNDRDHIDVAYVARLARLRLSDEEVATFQHQLEDVVSYVRKIGELDLSDAIYILSFLFVGGAIPPPPFPNFGLDPTEDLIPDCADEG